MVEASPDSSNSIRWMCVEAVGDEGSHQPSGESSSDGNGDSEVEEEEARIWKGRSRMCPRYCTCSVSLHKMSNHIKIQKYLGPLLLHTILTR